MRPNIDVDTSGFMDAIRKVDLSADDLKAIGFAGSAVVQMHQKTDVPVDTGATRSSVSDHIVTSTRTLFVDDIGPETDYAPYIENGVASKPNYPIQPFVRPSAHGNNRRDALNAIARSYHTWITSKWQK